MTGYQIAALISLLAFLIVLGPGWFMKAREGNWLANIALWLGVIVVLALLYQFVGPL